MKKKLTGEEGNLNMQERKKKMVNGEVSKGSRME